LSHFLHPQQKAVATLALPQREVATVGAGLASARRAHVLTFGPRHPGTPAELLGVTYVWHRGRKGAFLGMLVST
jgi:hypothetical protein